MFATDLICSNGHKFEAWFANHAAFERQRGNGLVTCPICHDSKIKQVFTPLRIKKHSDENATVPKQEKGLNIAECIQYIERNFDDVGSRFADEAIKMHIGDIKRHNIRGTATEEEEHELRKEGIQFFKIPTIQ